MDVNDSGQVVGTVNGHPFLWTQAGGLVGLGSLDGNPATGRASGINAGGQVVGSITAAFDGKSAPVHLDAGDWDDRPRRRPAVRLGHDGGHQRRRLDRRARDTLVEHAREPSASRLPLVGCGLPAGAGPSFPRPTRSPPRPRSAARAMPSYPCPCSRPSSLPPLRCRSSRPRLRSPRSVAMARTSSGAQPRLRTLGRPSPPLAEGVPHPRLQPPPGARTRRRPARLRRARAEGCRTPGALRGGARSLVHAPRGVGDGSAPPSSARSCEPSGARTAPARSRLRTVTSKASATITASRTYATACR